MSSKTQLMICKTCRAGLALGPDDIRPGAQLLAAAQAGDIPSGVEVIEAPCLSNCKRGCTAMLRGGAGKWTYVYGNLDAHEDAGILLEAAAKYHATEDGLIPFAERPQKLKQNTMARVPPVALPVASPLALPVSDPVTAPTGDATS